MNSIWSNVINVINLSLWENIMEKFSTRWIQALDFCKYLIAVAVSLDRPCGNGSDIWNCSL